MVFSYLSIRSSPGRTKGYEICVRSEPLKGWKTTLACGNLI